MKESLKKGDMMGKGFSHGLMEIFMMENGSLTKGWVMVFSNSKMEIDMKVTLEIASTMGKGFISQLMETGMKETF